MIGRRLVMVTGNVNFKGKINFNGSGQECPLYTHTSGADTFSTT